MTDIEHSELQHSEDIQDLGSELERQQVAFKLACTKLVELTEHSNQLTKTLTSALVLFDAMIRGFREHDIEPPPPLVYAKANFEAEMRKLLAKPEADKD